MPKTHPEVPFDSALIDQVAARLDLRIPNKEALEAVALELSETGGNSWYGICDLATAVGMFAEVLEHGRLGALEAALAGGGGLLRD